jgi:hypothetical protein
MRKRSSRPCVAAASCALALAWTVGAFAGVPPLPQSTSAQGTAAEPAGETLAKNSVFFEALGAGILYSVNYERMVLDELSVRVGFGYLPDAGSSDPSSQTPASTTSWTFIPMTVSYVGIRARRSALELGGGATLLFRNDSDIDSRGDVVSSGASVVPLALAMVGYRNQPVDRSGFMFRVGVQAIVAPRSFLSGPLPAPLNLSVLPWPYLSLGASF